MLYLHVDEARSLRRDNLSIFKFLSTGPRLEEISIHNMTNEVRETDSSAHLVLCEASDRECKLNSPEPINFEGIPGSSNNEVGTSTAKTKTAPSHPPDPVLVRYKHEYRNDTTHAVIHVEVSTEPFEVHSEASSVFDIVTTFNTPDNSTWDPSRKGLPQLVSTFGYKSIIIYSSSIINALRTIVDYESTETFSGDSIIIREPFAVLVHYYDQLTQYREKFDPRLGNRELCRFTKDIYLHLGLLVDHLDANVMPNVREEESRHRRGVATFDMLWLLWKPGCEVVGDGARGNFDLVSKRWDGFILHSVDYSIKDGRLLGYDLVLWGMQYNGKNLQSYEVTMFVYPFSGKRNIRDLPGAVPAQYWGNPNDPDYTVEYLKRRGMQYFSLMEKQCVYYAGDTLKHPFARVEAPFPHLLCFLNGG